MGRDGEDDRDHSGRVLGGDGSSPVGDEDVDRQPYQCDRQLGQPLVLALGKSVLKANVVPFHVAEVVQPLSERLGEGIGGRGRTQHTDEGDFVPRLRMGGERCCKQAEHERHDAPDGTPSHSHFLTLPLYRLLSLEAERPR